MSLSSLYLNNKSREKMQALLWRREVMPKNEYVVKVEPDLARDVYIVTSQTGGRYVVDTLTFATL